jgi:hypothetical protein
MFPKHKMCPQVEAMDARVLLSGFGPTQRKFVDVTGEFMRQDAWSAPKTTGRSVSVYNFTGSGGVATLGAVQTSGVITDTGRGDAHSYKGNVTLANNQGSVKITIRANSYKINGGTGVYKGATGLGVATFGTLKSNGQLVGIAPTGDV